MCEYHDQVSIHAPAWGATDGHGLPQWQCRVSIHAPAWGATRTDPKLIQVIEVSIHAPAWGATRRHEAVVPNAIVSIHAPAWGATYQVSPIRYWHECFNPRARMGRDEGFGKRPGTKGVSIHAPAWGATAMRATSGSAWTFQSTRPHGARRVRKPHKQAGNCFNPRARMGRDMGVMT